MMGLSNFGANQLMAANEHPPHLKAIFPQDPGWCYGMFREMHPGGVLSTLMYHLDHMDVSHEHRANPPQLPPEVEQLWKAALANPDYQMYKNLYNSLLNTQSTDKPDMYFILKDFRSYADAQKRVEEAYRDQQRWSRMAMMQTACSGKFSSDRTIEEYVNDIWHLEKVEVPSGQEA